MLRPVEIEIPENNPFQNCALGREKYADILTNMVIYYANEGCVLSLNAEWGAGKTTFVKMWQQKLKNEGFCTLYFNAWECDYTTDPLIAMLSKLEELHGNQETYQKIASNLGRILWAVTISAGKQFIKNKVGVDSEAVESAINEISEIGEEALKEYREQQGNLKIFRKLLTEYVASSSNKIPIIFFIDELDRCNPTFAVRLLERIKHLFYIPNIVFVLSINSKQLEYAIQGYYGSSTFNAKEYLRRFIDIEYNLPEPDLESFCRYLYRRCDFDSFFNNKERHKYSQLQNEGRAFMETIQAFVSPEQVSLREIEQISIINHKLDSDNLLAEIENSIPGNIFKKNQDSESQSIIYVIAQLIASYYLDEKDDQIENRIFKQEGTKELVSIFNPHLFSKNILDNALNQYIIGFNRMVPLSYIKERIELMNNLTIYE